MRLTFIYAGTVGMLLTLGCGAKVEIGHGAAGETSDGGAPGATGSAGSDAATTNPKGGDGSTPEVGNGGEAGSPEQNTGATGVGGPAIVDQGPQAAVGKVDLLLAIDNSISMADKQQLLEKAMPELVKRLVSPYCVNTAGVMVSQPAAAAACPTGSKREFAPLRDLHVGVITSSLGSHGASGTNDACTSATDDDHAQLLPFVREGLSSYQGKGFLKWDPDGLATPPGESDAQAFTDSVGAMLAAVGENGCGYEAQLESVYRFLVDPDPPVSVQVARGDSQAVKVGVDDSLLQQRADFLRPDSSVVVLMLTDENDCSVVDEGYGWLVARSSPMYRATSVCHQNPNDPCCQSCAEQAANPGCAALSEDTECVKGAMLAASEDDLNLRCFNQKGRFGFDLLYPTARYVGGFGGGTVQDRKGRLVQNPLFNKAGAVRDRSLFTLALIGGVPWQDLATTATQSGTALEYLTADALQTAKRWPVILGDPAKGVPPSDPFMQESIEGRGGKNPIANASIVPVSSTDPRANPINGHEQDAMQHDLQYACTFELPTPRTCDHAALTSGVGCDCFADVLASNSPLCNPPGGGAADTTQYYGKAYPTLRELDVARQLGRGSVLGSVCARNTTDDSRADYGYRPMFSALGRRVAATLTKP